VHLSTARQVADAVAAVAPVTFAFCSGPMVWRAARVAARFVTAAVSFDARLITRS